MIYDDMSAQAVNSQRADASKTARRTFSLMPFQVFHTAISLFFVNTCLYNNHERPFQHTWPQPGKVQANVSFSFPSLPLPRPPPPVVDARVVGPLIVDGVDFATRGFSPVAGVDAAMTGGVSDRRCQ